MKGLASGFGIILLAACVAYAGPLQMSIGGGPAAISLDEINAAIVVFNALIDHLNETFLVHPDVSGSVDTLSPMVTGIEFRAAERYGVTDWLGLGASFAYARSGTSTSGTYIGAETSVIDIDLDFQSLAALLTIRVTFLDMGIRISADASAGYYYVLFDHSITFEVPSEYTDALSGVPDEGSDRHGGGTLGFEVGLALDYSVTPWFDAGITLTYRSATVAELRNVAGEALDLDADGTSEGANLDGLSVLLGLAIQIDLSLDGGKE